MPVTKKESARARKIKKFKKEKPEEFEKIKSKIKEDKNTILYKRVEFWFHEVDLYRNREKELIKKYQPKFNTQWR